MGYLEDAMDRCGGNKPKKKRVSCKSLPAGSMTGADYDVSKLSIVSELARLEKIGWGNEKTDPTIFPYVIIEAINLLINSQPKKTMTDYTQTGEMACLMVEEILKSND